LGLTATPTDYIDHNIRTIRLRRWHTKYYYSYEQAIEDKNLVNYRVLDAQPLPAQRHPRRYAARTLKQMARDQGVELDELNFEGSDIEKSIINQGTNDAMVREFMDKSRKDVRGLPHKASSLPSAMPTPRRLYESFNRLYPELQRQGNGRDYRQPHGTR